MFAEVIMINWLIISYSVPAVRRTAMPEYAILASHRNTPLHHVTLTSAFLLSAVKLLSTSITYTEVLYMCLLCWDCWTAPCMPGRFYTEPQEQRLFVWKEVAGIRKNRANRV